MLRNTVFDPKSVAIAIITSYQKWYRGKLKSIKHTDKVRGDLALEFIKKAVQLGYVVVCADGKSVNSFRKELETIDNLKLIKRRSTVSGLGKRQTIKLAESISSVKVIILTEPEKVSIVTDCVKQIVGPILDDKVDIVVAKRNEELFKASYPNYMYESEIEGNKIYNEALRANGILKPHAPDLDFFFGPRAFRNDKKVVSIFTRRYRLVGVSLLSTLYDPDVYSNVAYFSIINALKKKLKVESAEVPFTYPLIQKENEDTGEREAFVFKRNLQRVSLLIDLMHFLSFLERKQSSKLRSIRK